MMIIIRTVIIIMIIIITTTIIIITLKGAIRDFFFSQVFSLRRELSPTRTFPWPRRSRVQITSGGYHVQRVRHVVRRDSSATKFWRSWNRVYFSLISLAETLHWWGALALLDTSTVCFDSFTAGMVPPPPPPLPPSPVQSSGKKKSLMLDVSRVHVG